MALTAFVLSPALHRLNRRTIGVSGAVLICAGNAASFASSTAALLFLARAVAGAGSGAIMSATAAVASEHRNPHKVFSAMTGITMLVAIGMFMLVPRLAEQHGARSIFLAMALLALIAAAVSLWLPKWSSEKPGEPEVNDAGTHPFALFQLPSFLLCGAWLFFFIALNGAYFYVERIGSSIGMRPSEIGDGLALASFISLAGPVLASVLGLRFGRIGPLIVAVILNAAGVLAMTQTGSPAVFVVSIAVSTMMLTFAPPYALGLAASLVASGRLTSAARGSATLGSTITPAVSALVLMQGGSYITIGWVAAACSAVAIMLLIALHSISRKQAN